MSTVTAGTSKALAINVDDLDDAKPTISSRAPKKLSQTPKRPKVESIDLSAIADSDEDDVVFQKKNWKGKIPPANLKKNKNKPSKPPALQERRSAAKKRAASYDSDSDYEQPPAKRVTRQSRARAKGKAKAEVYSLSDSSDHVAPAPTLKKRQSLPQSSGSAATASSSTAASSSIASTSTSSRSQAISSIFQPPPSKLVAKPLEDDRSRRPDDQPPPKKRPKLSKPPTSTANRMSPPPSPRAATMTSSSAPQPPKPKRAPLSAITTEDEVRKVTVDDRSSISRPRLTGSPRNAVPAKVPPSGGSKQPFVAHGSSRDLPVHISDDDNESAETERTPSPELDALNDAWIYDLEGTEPAPPPAHMRSCSPIGRDERSPSPQIGPLQEECVYSLEGFQLNRYWARPRTPKEEHDPDVKKRDLRLTADTSHDQIRRPGMRYSRLEYGGLQSSRGAGASRQSLPRVADKGLGIVRVRLGAGEVAVSTRLDILRRVRQPGGLGLGMRTSAHNRRGVAYSFPPRTGHSFAASGAVNDILQKNGWIAAGCSTSCQDDSEPVLEADNKHHTLAVFSALRNRWDGHDAHSRTFDRQDAHGRAIASIVRHYTVESVAWDPMHESRLVSCGVDGSVVLWEPRGDGQMGVMRRWDMKQRAEDNRANTHYVYDSASSDVTFPRDAPVFAVGPTKTGQVHIHAGPFEDVDDDQHVAILLRQARGTPGPLQWGHAQMNNVLFAGMTSAYNAEGVELYTLPDIQGSDKMGVDAMDLDPLHGGMFAVVANSGRHTKRYLHLYDVDSSTSDWIARVELDIDRRRHRQVTAVSFSPDGVLLALAHEDNSVYVFDTRFLDDTGGRTEQALYRFKHGDCAVPGEDSFGVTSIAWAPSSGPLSSGSGGYGLYSGGADGHVRLWRTGLSANNSLNGSIVASVDAGIGSFSLGDVFAGEKMLVVGDNNGKLAVWDRLLAPPEAH